MLPKLLKLNANEAIKWSTTISSSGMCLRKTCRPSAVHARGLLQLRQDRLERSERDREYGEVSQTLTRIPETFAQLESNSHGTSMCSSLLTTPKSSFKSPARPAATGSRESRTGDEEHAVRAQRSASRLVERDREQQAEHERDQHRQEREVNVQTNTRTNGSLTRGLWRILSKFAQPVFVFQPGSSSSPERAVNEPFSLSTTPSAIRVELIANRVVAQRRRELDCGVQPLGPDRRVA